MWVQVQGLQGLMGGAGDNTLGSPSQAHCFRDTACTRRHPSRMQWQCTPAAVSLLPGAMDGPSTVTVTAACVTASHQGGLRAALVTASQPGAVTVVSITGNPTASPGTELSKLRVTPVTTVLLSQPSVPPGLQAVTVQLPPSRMGTQLYVLACDKGGTATHVLQFEDALPEPGGSDGLRMGAGAQEAPRAHDSANLGVDDFFKDDADDFLNPLGPSQMIGRSDPFRSGLAASPPSLQRAGSLTGALGSGMGATSSHASGFQLQRMRSAPGRAGPRGLSVSLEGSKVRGLLVA